MDTKGFSRRYSNTPREVENFEHATGVNLVWEAEILEDKKPCHARMLPK